jgi:preprotein translocase subunit SecG
MMILGAWYHSILATLFAMLAVMLMLIILLQRGKGVGLAGAFGGAGTATAFGSKTGDFLTWATIVLAGIFMLFTILLNFVFVPEKAIGRLGPGPVPLVVPESEQPVAPEGASGPGEAPIVVPPEPAVPPTEAPPPADDAGDRDPGAADEGAGQPD